MDRRKGEDMRIWWQLYINIAVILPLTLIILYIFFNLVLQSVKDFKKKPGEKIEKIPILSSFNPFIKLNQQKEQEEKKLKKEKDNTKWKETQRMI